MKILCARLSNDRKTNLGEIEKLMTFMGGKKDIAVGDVERIVSDASSSSADDVCYYAAGGDSEKAQKAFRKMINEGSEPISIVRNLTYHFNKLLTVLGHMETGEPVDKAVYKLVPRIIFYREPAFKRQLGFWRKDKLLGVTELLYKCERDCKSTNMPAEEIVSYTIMQISSGGGQAATPPLLIKKRLCRFDRCRFFGERKSWFSFWRCEQRHGRYTELPRTSVRQKHRSEYKRSGLRYSSDQTEERPNPGRQFRLIPSSEHRLW